MVLLLSSLPLAMERSYTVSQAESLFHQPAQSDCIELMLVCETNPETLNVYRTVAYEAVYELVGGTVHVDMCVEAMLLCQLAANFTSRGVLTDSASSGKSNKFRMTTSQRTYRSLR